MIFFTRLSLLHIFSLYSRGLKRKIGGAGNSYNILPLTVPLGGKESLKSRLLLEFASIVLAPALTLCSEPEVPTARGLAGERVGGEAGGGERGFSCAMYGLDAGAGEGFDLRL